MKYSDVKWYYKYGQEVRELFKDIQPVGDDIGYYSPSSANWNYAFKIVRFNGEIYEVMTRFGSVEGGRLVVLPDNVNKAGV